MKDLTPPLLIKDVLLFSESSQKQPGGGCRKCFVCGGLAQNIQLSAPSSFVPNPQYQRLPSCCPTLLHAPKENGNTNTKLQRVRASLAGFKSTFLPSSTKAKAASHLPLEDSTEIRPLIRSRSGIIPREPRHLYPQVKEELRVWSEAALLPLLKLKQPRGRPEAHTIHGKLFPLKLDSDSA